MEEECPGLCMGCRCWNGHYRHPACPGQDDKRVRFDGSWLVSNPAIGIRWVEHISSLDPSGNRLAFTMDMLSGDPTVYGLCPEADYISAGVGEAVRTGLATVDATIMLFAMRKKVPRDQIECIWVMSGSSTFTEDTQDAVLNFAIYPLWMDSEIDSDGDMLPDEGVEPIACFPIGFHATRVPIMAPSE